MKSSRIPLHSQNVEKLREHFSPQTIRCQVRRGRFNPVQSEKKMALFAHFWQTQSAMKALIPLVIVISTLLIPPSNFAETVEITASRDGYEVVKLPSKNGTATTQDSIESEVPACAPKASPPTVWHSILCKSSQNAISVSTAYLDNGIGIIEWENHRSDDQQWRIVPGKGGWFHLIARHSGKALTIREGKTEENTEAIQWDVADHDSQLWKMEFDEDGFARLKNKSSSLYLATYSKGGNHGRNLLQKPKAATDDQKWLFQIVDVVE